MPTTTPLTDAITALTTYSNTVTGASDTDLSSAVATLIAGYGGGSDEVWELINEVTLSEATRTWEITTDSNGDSFSLSKMLVVFTAYHTGDSTTNKNAQWGANAYDFLGGIIRHTSWQNRCCFYYADATLPRKMAISFYHDDWTTAYDSQQVYAGKVNNSNSYQFFFNPSGTVSAMTNFKIQMASVSDTMAGGKLKIYGVRS